MSPSPKKADNSTKERNQPESDAFESCEKSHRVRKKPPDDEPTVFEEVCAPVRPATVSLPHRWEKRHEKEIEKLRKAFRADLPKRGKMTFSDLHRLSSDFDLAESTKQRPTSSRERRMEAEAVSWAPEEQRTLEVEPEPCPRVVKEKEPSRIEALDRSTRSTRVPRAQRTTVTPPPAPSLLPTSPPYFTAKTHRSSSPSPVRSDLKTDGTERSSRSEKKLQRVKEFATSVAKNLLSFRKTDASEVSHRSERKPRHSHKEHAPPQQPRSPQPYAYHQIKEAAQEHQARSVHNTPR
uniref:TPX2 domain-containing protein n=1 Tax=Steinernema glaseri TaxID=37863 RepID=A0A1I7YS94_9BILA